MDSDDSKTPDIEEIGFDRPCTAPLGATVKPYQVHVLFCLGGEPEEWPAKVEYIAPLYGALKDQVKSRSKSMKIKVKTAACDAPRHPRDDACNLLCFGVARKEGGKNWMAKIVALTLADFDDFFAFLEDGIERSLTVHALKEAHVAVCCHTAEDGRCGYCGNRIADLLKNSSIGSAQLLRTTHVGGHKYAANVITYPSGHWWGYVKPRDIARLLPMIPLGTDGELFSPENLLTGPPPGLLDLWRGRMGLSKEQQAQQISGLTGSAKGDNGSPSPVARAKEMAKEKKSPQESSEVKSISPSPSTSTSTSTSTSSLSTSSSRITQRAKVQALTPLQGWENRANQRLLAIVVLLIAFVAWAFFNK